MYNKKRPYVCQHRDAFFGAVPLCLEKLFPFLYFRLLLTVENRLCLLSFNKGLQGAYSKPLLRTTYSLGDPLWVSNVCLYFSSSSISLFVLCYVIIIIVVPIHRLIAQLQHLSLTDEWHLVALGHGLVQS